MELNKVLQIIDLDLSKNFHFDVNVEVNDMK